MYKLVRAYLKHTCPKLQTSMKDIDEGYTGEAILHVVYYGVDITLVYFSAKWSCFFSAIQFFFGRLVFYVFGRLDSAICASSLFFV